MPQARLHATCLVERHQSPLGDQRAYEAHEALISLRERLSEEKIEGALVAAGIDLNRAKSDLAANQSEVDAILARNHEQATALGFQGTPAFIIGDFRVPGAPNAEAFKQAIADARAASTQTITSLADGGTMT